MKRIVAGGVFFSAIADTAVGTVCPNNIYTDGYGGTDTRNFFDNLVVAAAVDFTQTTDNTGKLGSAALLAAAFQLPTYGLSPSTIPVLNTHLTTALVGSGGVPTGCGVCAYTFYSDVIDAINSHVIATAPTPDYVCLTSGVTSVYGFPTHANYYSGWAIPNMSLTGLDLINRYSCISQIQHAIDSFNRCANNGYDVRTGSPNIQCSNQDDFTNLDAKFGAYKLLMDKALQGIDLPTDFKNAYSVLPCRSCFDNFVTQVASHESDLWKTTGGTPGHCQSGGAAPFATEYYNTMGCLSTTFPAIVSTAVDDLSVCSGSYNRLYANERFAPSADDQVYFNQIFNSYETLVVCSEATDPGAVTDTGNVIINTGTVTAANPTWLDCLETGLGKLPTNVGCFMKLGHNIKVDGGTPALGALDYCDPTVSPNGPFTTDCLTALANNRTNPDSSTFTFSSDDSAFMTFYHCSGFKLDATKSTCTTAQIASIPSAYKTFVPVLEIALWAGSDSVLAGKTVLANSDIVGGPVGLTACASCYSRLATDFSQSLTPDDIALCENPYSNDCKSAINVVAALGRFKSCAGYTLSNGSGSLCPIEEWNVLQSANVPEKLFDSAVHPENTKTLLEAQQGLKELFEMVETDIPTMTFRCRRCFEILLNDLYALSTSAIEACQMDILSADCYSEGAYLAFAKFNGCSGYTFEFVQATTTAPPIEVSSTAVPDIPTTTAAPETSTTSPAETSAPTTTKSSIIGGIGSFAPSVGVALIAVLVVVLV